LTQTGHTKTEISIPVVYVCSVHTRTCRAALNTLVKRHWLAARLEDMHIMQSF